MKAIAVFLMTLFSLFTQNLLFAEYTGLSLKIPMEKGSSIFCTVETGGEIAPILLDPNALPEDKINSGHTGKYFYALDFDDRFAGDPVLAAAAGTVKDLVKSGCSNGGTMCYVTLDHGKGYTTHYYHLNLGSIPVEIGNTVLQGQQIGVIGNTGKAFGPHLHFEVRYNYDASEGNENLREVKLEGTRWIDYRAGNRYDSSNILVNPETCKNVQVPVYSDPRPVTMVLTDPAGDGTWNIHAYKQEADNTLTVINDTALGNNFPDPIIANQGKEDGKKATLVGDVNADGWDDLIMINEPDATSFTARVWKSRGDGTFDAVSKWLVSTTDNGGSNNNADLYFVGDQNGDGPDDLILATHSAPDTVSWKYCLANTTGTTGVFDPCVAWLQDYGKSTDTDIFLVADIDDDGYADILRGYQTDDNAPCPIHGTAHTKLTWRVRNTRTNQNTIWMDNWGCPLSKYLLANVDEPYMPKLDLIQIRFDDSTIDAPTAGQIGHVFVALNEGGNFTLAQDWEYQDFGSPKHSYFVWDVDGDGLDDILYYLDKEDTDTGQPVNVIRSLGDDFDTRKTLLSVNKASNGAIRFGHFGEVKFITGTKTEQQCSTASVQSITEQYPTDGTLIAVDNTVYEFWAWDDSWHGYPTPDVFNACLNDWGSIQTATSDAFAGYPLGSVVGNSFDCGVTYPGQLIAWNNTVYYITPEGKKRGFTTDYAFNICGMNWAELQYLASDQYAVVTTLMDGPVITGYGDCPQLDVMSQSTPLPADGTLIAVENTVYEFWDVDDSWHGYPTPDVFNACLNDWGSIQTATSEAFAGYPIGSVVGNSFDCGVTYPEQLLLWNNTVYYITPEGKKRGFTTDYAFNTCHMDWAALEYIASEQYAVLTTLMDGPVITGYGDCPNTSMTLQASCSSPTFDYCDGQDNDCNGRVDDFDVPHLVTEFQPRQPVVGDNLTIIVADHNEYTNISLVETDPQGVRSTVPIVNITHCPGSIAWYFRRDHLPLAGQYSYEFFLNFTQSGTIGTVSVSP